MKSFYLLVDSIMRVKNVGDELVWRPGGLFAKRGEFLPFGNFYMDEATGSWKVEKEEGVIRLSYFSSLGAKKWERAISEPGLFLVNAKSAIKLAKKNAPGFEELMEKHPGKIVAKTGDLSEVSFWVSGNELVSDGDIVVAGRKASLKGSTYAISFALTREHGYVARVFVRENDDLAVKQAANAIERFFELESSSQTQVAAATA